MDLNSIRYFVSVIESGSFTEAARSLGVPKSTVSDKVAELESRLGVALLTRTTRKLRLTDAGESYFKRASAAMAEIAAAREEASKHQEKPTGILKITTPAEHVTDAVLLAVAQYRKKHPEVQVLIDLSNEAVDLVAEGYDLGIRAGTLEDSSLIAQRIGTGRLVLVSSKSYLKSAPPLRHPKDLGDHTCVNFSDHASDGLWKFKGPAGKQTQVSLKPAISCNSFSMIKGLVARGHGLAYLPIAHCKKEIQRGELVHVLAEWSSADIPINLVYPAQKYRSPKVREMIPLLTAQLKAVFQ